ncbi:usg protein [Oceanomicrobium pacificus]|uniref:Aspartate-semialdehyde dehydrogenase n=1 Tax=Oceanomicrobium pacificus TaxID=2692916 RepID=A0A6B0TWK9_9RHOB|nr:usg protein [Oceanomicrobium pacificus]MXU65888.1 aspartate-semialdehyde dehydrogenase [Oceanomicrobium pacificus]
MSKDTEMMLNGYGLTTAEYLYRMPDARSLLQTFTWQHYDLAPEFPELKKFIAFWQEKLDGPLERVRFVHRRLIAPGEWRKVDGEILIQ